MNPALWGAVPAILAAVGGIIIALNARKEATVKAQMNPLDVTAKALQVAGEWIDRLREDLEATERECNKRIAEMQARIDQLQRQVDELTRG